MKLFFSLKLGSRYGRTNPGHTADAVAIRFAISSGADKCIIATNVPKVFDSDPKSNPNANSI